MGRRAKNTEETPDEDRGRMSAKRLVASTIESPKWSVYHGDALEWLRSKEDCSFDGMLSDPPAGISFMGAMCAWDSDKGGRDSWIAWLAEVMREAVRALRPGAYGLVWAIPRTAHWTAMALENAGFQVKDVLQHLYASGFPKSMNIAKAIDASPGSEMSASAKRWEGYGTALKPGAEMWILVRKPVRGTIIANALEHGTGALNIDAARIAHANVSDFEAHKASVDAIKARGGTMNDSWKNASDLSGASDVSRLGRWPANVIFSHHEDCRMTGTRKVAAHPSWNDNRGPSSFTGKATSHVRHADDDGTETVEAWECAEGCAVAELDRQSGQSVSTDAPRRMQPNAGHQGGRAFAMPARISRSVHADSGAASRFFFVAKSSRWEREFGCEQLPHTSASEAVDRAAGSPGIQSPRAGANRGDGARNNHPTLKPIALAKHLATLLLPPPREDGHPRRMLVPFAGSGSEMIGARRAGWTEVHGVEQDSHFVTIARARLTRWDDVPAHLEPDEVRAAASREQDGRQIPLFEKVGQ